MKSGYVYFFKHNGLEPIKIGMTGDVFTRFISFSTYSPYGSKHIGTIKTSDCEKLEKEIHKICEKKKLKGEWFNVTEKEAVRIIKKYNGYIGDKIETHPVGKDTYDSKTEKIKRMLIEGFRNKDIAEVLKTPHTYVSKIKRQLNKVA